MEIFEATSQAKHVLFMNTGLAGENQVAWFYSQNSTHLFSEAKEIQQVFSVYITAGKPLTEKN